MDKWQSQQAFWSSFGIDAYDDQTEFTEGSLPAYPHITYESFTGTMGQEASISASIWYRTPSWAPIKKKADEILEYMQEHEPLTFPLDKGYIWFKVPRLVPFAQPASSGSDDEQIKRIVITIDAECLS